MTRRRTAIVEFNTWHGECLTPQIAYLKANGDDVTLICPKKTTTAIAPRVLDGVELVTCDEKKSVANVWRVWRTLWRGGFDAIVLNTAQGSECLKLSLLPKPRNTAIVGTIHNLKKLTSSTGQRLVNRMLDGILVIAPYLIPHVPQIGKPTGYYSPLKGAPLASTPLEKGTDTWLVVPGSIEFKRRNFKTLIDIATATRGLPIKYVILGNSTKADGPELKRMVSDAGLDEAFVFFDGFVDAVTFDAYVSAADYLLPLIDDKLPNGADYLTRKTSGTFSLSARFGKTMLCDKFLTPMADFYPCVFYNDAADLIEIVGRHEQAAAKTLDFDEEATRYNKLINSTLKKIFVTISIIAATALSAEAQDGSRDTLLVGAEAWASVSSDGDLRPLLSYSNEWGRYTQYDRGEAATSAFIAYGHTFKNPNLRFKGGLTAQLSSDGDRTMLQELYADFDLWMFAVKMGMENYTPVLTNRRLSMGSYLMSNNARTLPKAWVGILDYWALPIKCIPADIASIRGGVSFGWMDDEGKKGYTDDALISEKYAYGRVGHKFLWLYGGLYHSVIMGGRLSDGTKVPKQFWKSFFAKSGDPDVFGNGMFRGETTNAAGAHQGMWDFGLDISLPRFDATLYYQRPFADSKAHGLFGSDRKDLTAGALVKFKGTRFVKEAALEFMTTKWQGDEGTPDPYVPNKSGGWTALFPGDYATERIGYLKKEVLIPEDVAAWEATHGEIKNSGDLFMFCQETYNRGLEYGGRTLYLTNYCVEQGWTRGGLSMGTPLFHTRKTVARYAPEYADYLEQTFPNLRVVAINIGVSGDIVEGLLDYALRITPSRNYGNYSEKYVGGSFSWTEKEKYLFTSAKNETYTRLDLNARLRRGWSIRTSWTYDFGDLYHSFAARVGVKYEIGL